MKVELRGIKGHEGPDSYCFRATLLLDGKKCGEVMDDGNGGAISFTHQLSERELQKYAETLPHKNFPEEWGGGSYPQSADSLVHDALSEYLEQRRLKTMCRTKTVFTMPSTPDGMVEVLRQKFTPEIKAYLVGKYGPEITILNETLTKS